MTTTQNIDNDGQPVDQAWIDRDHATALITQTARTMASNADGSTEISQHNDHCRPGDEIGEGQQLFRALQTGIDAYYGR